MDMSFARKIRELRNKKGWSVYDLAKKLKNDKRGKAMTAGYISKIEARGEIPSPGMIVQLAEIFKVSTEELFEIAKQEKAEQLKKNVVQKYDDALSLYRKSRKK